MSRADSQICELVYQGHSPACGRWYLTPVVPEVPVSGTCGTPIPPQRGPIQAEAIPVNYDLQASHHQRTPSQQPVFPWKQTFQSIPEHPEAESEVNSFQADASHYKGSWKVPKFLRGESLLQGENPGKQGRV